ncbi:MAG: DUF1190 domain-containing protein [Alphaproteobacteria bacterium]|nr:DUF1190 domain-containing protein [Alphaproteobacteria bacterium]
MRRSRNINLVLLGSAGVLGVAGLAAWGLSGSSTSEAQLFKDAEECASVLPQEAQRCQEAQRAAVAAHRTSAPAFASLESCAVRYGRDNCQPLGQTPSIDQVQAGESAQNPAWAQGRTASSSSSWFIPAMLGYMVGRSTAGMGAGLMQPRPVYRDNVGQAFSGLAPVGRFRGGRFEEQPVAGTSSSSGFRSSSWGWGGRSSTSSPRTASTPSVSRSGFGSTGARMSAGS